MLRWIFWPYLSAQALCTGTGTLGQSLQTLVACVVGQMDLIVGPSQGCSSLYPSKHCVQGGTLIC